MDVIRKNVERAEFEGGRKLGLLDPPDEVESPAPSSKATRSANARARGGVLPEMYWAERTMGHDRIEQSWPTSKKTTQSGEKRI